MNFPTVSLQALSSDLLLFLPELIVVCAIVVMLLMRLTRAFDRTHLGGVALTATLLALAVSGWQWYEESKAEIFTGLVAVDDLTIYLRMVLLGATALTILLTLQTGIPDAED